MPKCLFRYQWVKLPRAHLPVGKGIMGYWAKLASRAAFRKGRAKYCGYTNDVMPGMWSGGVVGLKSILGVKSRTEALEIMDTLSRFGYIRYTLDEKTKKLEYVVTDWVVKCSGAECMSGAVYATDGYGFLCLPRNITQRLADQRYTFGESDAWLDLWCHTVWQETGNTFSYLAPAVQFGRLGAALTLEALGRRWGWEKTKVWRFFQKNGDAFALHRLPGSYGCLIFNRLYPLDTEASLPTGAEIERIIEKMRICAGNAHIGGSDNARLNKMILWYKGGCFSTYAYRLIWNEICTALIYANRLAAKECELIPEVLGKEDSLDEHHELSMILDRLEANASEAMAKGIRAIRLSAEGYSHAEIGSILGESDKCVAARISRTRKYLRSHPDLAAF